MQKRENKLYREYWLVFLIAALPKVWMALQTIPVKTLSDEMATVASAAKLAGYDWSWAVSRAGYYGAGFYWIFAPVFKLTDNPFIIYRCILVGCSLVQALIAPICYYLMIHMLKSKDKKYAFISSIACAYMVITRTTVVFNEHILVVLIWLTALFLVKIQEYQEVKKKKRIYTALLFIVLAYGLTIHARMATLWIGLALLVAAYGIVYRRFFLSKSVLVIFGAGGYGVAMKLVSKVQEILWRTGHGSDLRNASVNVSFALNWLSLRTWKAWGSIIIGQIQTINMVTGGLVILFLFLFLFFLLRWISDRRKNNPVKPEENYYIILIFFFLCCTAMTIAAQSVSWLPGAAEGISHGYKSSDYGVKAYTYLRYFGVYIGPLLMCGLSMLGQYGEEEKKAILFAVTVSGIFLFIWFTVIQPFIYENVYTSEAFTGLSFFRRGEQFELRHYLIALLWMVIIGGLLHAFILKGQRDKMIYLLTFYLIFQYCTNGARFDISRQEMIASWVDGGYQTVKELEKTIEVPKKIYCYDGKEKTDHYLFQLYQFYLNRYQIMPASSEEADSIPSGQLVFSNMEDDKTLLKKGYSCIRLDDNEYLYVDQKYKDVIQ